MKYTVHINQKQALALGITNINQAAIFDLLTTASTWATAEIVGDQVFYWVARQKVVDELPLLGLKPDTVYRHLKHLADAELIHYIKKGKKDCIKVTEKGRGYVHATMSEIDPSRYVGNESEKPQNSEMNPSKLGNESEKHSDLNPTYKTTNINPTTNDKGPTKGQTPFDLFWMTYPVKVKKKQAKEIWQRKRLNGKADQIAADVQQRIRKDPLWLDGFTPHPTTYLNGERWDDDIQTIPAPVTDRSQGTQARLPKRDDELMHWAQQHGYPTAAPGMGFQEYRRMLEQKIRNRGLDA